jgi:hypothetical protein
MSLMADVANITIQDRPMMAVGRVPQSMTITVPRDSLNIEVTVPQRAAHIDINVPGPQGPPGLKNVYVQQNNPAVEFGWGPEQEGFIWARIT